MCHADQELNRSLTETAVKFSSKVQAGKSEDEERIEGEEAETVWVGDTYFLIPKRLFEVSTVVFEERQDDQQTVMRCTRCSNVLGEMSSSATAGNATTVKLSKYMVEPLSSSTPKSTNTWVATLLAALQYSAASHGSRRFLIQPSSPSATDQQGVEAWLFSRALFTTSLTRHWSTLQGQVGESVWKGHRLFYRTPSASTETEAAETIELSPPIYRWMLEAMSQCNSSLPSELSKVLPLWNTAYLARSVDEEQ
ncbi:uncharacterized protein SPSC_04800 [Sporisorium scitamineum]|uniref:Uncharacterized protein n=1 Tax=Sporisorium scitamineum TaxID=49012 RepID=A0A127ZH45_9BASI|nr:uncharacterized protein SPSC_04800 [Sporisorium scitamineum]